MTPNQPTESDVHVAPGWRWAFVVAIALLLLSGGLAIHQYLRFSDASSRIDRTHQVLNAIDALLAHLLDTETGARGYLLTGNDSFLAPYTEAEPQVAAAAARLSELVADIPEQHDHARNLIDLSRERASELRSAIETFKKGRSSDAVGALASGRSRRLMDQIRSEAAEMKAAENTVLAAGAHEAQLARRTSVGFAISTLLIAIILGFVAVVVDRGFQRRRAALEIETTKRQLAENSVLSATQELHRTESFNRTILDNSGDCIQVIEPDGTVVSMNRAGIRLMEVDDASRFNAQPWAKLWNGSGQSATEALAAAVATGEGRFQGFCATARGTPKWWDVLITPIRDDAGHVAKLLSISRDISEQKQAAEERDELLESERVARSEAERATQMKDEFLATLSHELRTPLNSIVGWVGVLKHDQSRDTLRKAVDVIDRNSRRQAQMIDDLLDVSRIVSGKLPLDVQRVDLVPVVEEAIASSQPAADAKGVHLTTVFTTPATVLGDAIRLQQVVWNLVSNAIKFTGREGTVQVTLRETDGHAQIEVRDSGQGVAADLLPHIFQRFRQGDSSSTRRHGGLGLGLAIVKNLTEMHGGSVAASSEGPGTGSVFTVMFPLAMPVPAPDAHGAEPPVRPTALLENVLVLVVDDEADARDLVQRLLEDAGARVSAWDTAQSALQGMRAGLRPDVIVSDVAMPEQDGYDFMKQVRQMDAPMSSVPAAALTALARVADRRRALMAGYQTHLTKPVDPTELVATVASLAGRTGKSYV